MQFERFNLQPEQSDGPSTSYLYRVRARNMPPSGRKRRDRGAQFIRSNLELLGFGSRRDALVQAVKELFENGGVTLCRKGRQASD